MWKGKFDLTEQQIEIKLKEDKTNYCFLLNIKTIFEDIISTKVLIETRDRAERIRVAKAKNQIRKPLSNSLQLKKTVIEGKQPEEEQIARKATLSVMAPTQATARAPTQATAPTLAPGRKGLATQRTALRQGTIRPGTGLGGQTGVGPQTLNRWMTKKPGDQ